MRGKILIKSIDAVILLGGGAPLGTKTVSVAVRDGEKARARGMSCK